MSEDQQVNEEDVVLLVKQDLLDQLAHKENVERRVKAASLAREVREAHWALPDPLGREDQLVLPVRMEKLDHLDHLDHWALPGPLGREEDQAQAEQ